MEFSFKNSLLDLITEIQGISILKGYTSYMEGDDVKNLRLLFESASLTTCDSLLHFYSEFKEYKFDYSLRKNALNLNYIDKELDFICGSCNIIAAEKSLSLVEKYGVFLIDYISEEITIGLSVLDKEIIDNIQILNFKTNGWEEIGLSLSEYIIALRASRGFNGWQMALKDNGSKEFDTLQHYLPQIFELSSKDMELLGL